MPESLIGTVLEKRFEILEIIGQGGMATVYKAQHLAVDLQVAIKILNLDPKSSSADIERLKREAIALNSLFHPNVVKVYSFGFLDSGEPYIVLDFLNGRNLDEFIGSEIAELDWALEVFMQICHGLAYAHQNNLIHRDLKPSNVMIVDKDEDGAFVKLVDFGIAKASNRKEQRLTSKGEIFGSPLYMSPEQISGQELAQSSDIYSFGCLMYEVLAGQPPFEGDSAFRTMMMHMHDTPAPVSTVASHKNLPADLDAIILKCLEKNPQNRYSNACELAFALKKCTGKN